MHHIGENGMNLFTINQEKFTLLKYEIEKIVIVPESNPISGIYPVVIISNLSSFSNISEILDCAGQQFFHVCLKHIVLY